MFYFCSTESALNAITSYFIRVVLDRFALGSADRRCQSMKRRQLLKMAARLLEYYQEMTSPEQGERLMDRTMSYCSAEDGWVLRGSAAAELFGVATQI